MGVVGVVGAGGGGDCGGGSGVSLEAGVRVSWASTGGRGGGLPGAQVNGQIDPDEEGPDDLPRSSG